jgi:hypothetical protein
VIVRIDWSFGKRPALQLSCWTERYSRRTSHVARFAWRRSDDLRRAEIKTNEEQASAGGFGVHEYWSMRVKEKVGVKVRQLCHVMTPSTLRPGLQDYLTRWIDMFASPLSDSDGGNGIMT